MDLHSAIDRDGDMLPLSVEQVGGVLAFARRERGLDVPFVAAELRIPKAYINALENGQFDDLPGVAYIPGYIRSYAKLLDIDSEPLIQAYRRSLQDDDIKPKYTFPEQVLTPKMAGSMLASLLVIAGLVSYVGWFLLERPSDQTISDQAAIITAAPAVTDDGTSAQDVAATQSAAPAITDAEDIIATTTPDIVAPIPEFELAQESDPGPTPRPADLEKLSLPAGTDKTILATVKEAAGDEADDTAIVAEAAAGNDGAAKPSDDSEAAEEAPTDIASAAPSEAQTAESADSAGATLTASAESTTPGSANATAVDPSNEMLIRAVAASWVEIVRDNGEIVVSKLMRSGDMLAASLEDDLFLSTGNAGGLTLETAAMDAFRAGKVGEILRDFPLTSDMLRTRQTQIEN